MPGQERLIGVFNRWNRPPAASASDIHDALLDAIVVQDLPPGTKLGEELLVEIFDLSRRHASAALDRLGWEGLVTRLPNRGAWVAAPDAAEARDIFAARRTIESGIVETLARAYPRPDFEPILAELAQEHAARAQGQLREAIRLSGRFHILLARLSGHRILADQVGLLVARTSLVVALYERPDAMTCWRDDHTLLLETIRAGQVNVAVELMRAHLQALFDELDLTRQAALDFDPRRVFRLQM
ncbi:MAG: GntR family transcriptional regulator [Janthinobacterium lividum]